MRQIAMTIVGMSSGGCVNAVRKALGAVPGTCVDAVSVGSATVSYDASITSPAAMAEALGNAGYLVRAVRMPVANPLSVAGRG